LQVVGLIFGWSDVYDHVSTLAALFYRGSNLAPLLVLDRVIEEQCEGFTLGTRLRLGQRAGMKRQELD
jgi:hypothetical protein